MDQNKLLMFMMLSGLGNSSGLGSGLGSGSGLGDISGLLFMSMLTNPSGSSSSPFDVPYTSGSSGSGSGINFGDETIKILSIPISRQLLDTVSLKLGRMSEQEKNQLISSLVLMLIADKEGGDVGDMLSMAAMMGLSPLMSSVTGTTGTTNGSVKVYNSTSNSMPSRFVSGNSLNYKPLKVGGTVLNRSDITEDVKGLEIAGDSLPVANGNGLHKQYLDAKKLRRKK